MSNLAPALAGLKPWQPGLSGNPDGKPKQKPVTDAIRKFLGDKVLREMPGYPDHTDKTYLNAIAWRLVNMAVDGDIRAAELIMDRIEGKVAGTSGMTMLVQINSPVFGQDGLMAEPADQLGQFGDDGRIAITVDVVADETVVSEPTSTP